MTVEEWRVQQKAYYAAQRKAKRRAYNKSYHEANRKKRNAQARAYYKTHQEKLLAQAKAYHKAHPEKAEKARLRAKAWREANPEKARASVQAWRKANPERRRVRLDKEQYGLGPTARQEMYKRQGGKCAICGEGRPLKGHGGLHVDHNHRSSLVRGLLCNSCNRGLGIFKDNPELLMAAAGYLVKPPTPTNSPVQLNLPGV